MTNAEHDRIAEAIDEAAEVLDTALSEAEQTCGWIVAFQGERGYREWRLDLGDHDALVELLDLGGRSSQCFHGTDDRLYLQLPALTKHVMHTAARTTQQDVATRLGRLGFGRKQLTVRDGERTLKRRYWRSPVGFDPQDHA